MQIVSGIGVTLTLVGFIVFALAFPVGTFRAFVKKPSERWLWTAAGALGFLCVGVLMVGISEPSDHTKVADSAPTTPKPTAWDAPTPTAEPTPEATPPTVDHRAERRAILIYWTKVIDQLSMSQVELDFARVSIGAGDLVQASQMLTNAKNAADEASSSVVGSVPEPLKGEPSDNLFAATQEFKDACQAAKDYLDSNKPSDMAVAKDHGMQGRSYLDQAQHQARVIYRDELSGNPMDLPDVDREHVAAVKMFRQFMGRH